VLNGPGMGIQCALTEWSARVSVVLGFHFVCETVRYLNHTSHHINQASWWEPHAVRARLTKGCGGVQKILQRRMPCKEISCWSTITRPPSLSIKYKGVWHPAQQ
jgi:hypothetical protein